MRAFGMRRGEEDPTKRNSHELACQRVENIHSGLAHGDAAPRLALILRIVAGRSESSVGLVMMVQQHQCTSCVFVVLGFLLFLLFAFPTPGYTTA